MHDLPLVVRPFDLHRHPDAISGKEDSRSDRSRDAQAVAVDLICQLGGEWADAFCLTKIIDQIDEFLRARVFLSARSMVLQEMWIAVDEDAMKSQLREFNGFPFQSAFVKLEREEGASDESEQDEKSRSRDKYFDETETLALASRKGVNGGRKRQITEYRQGRDSEEK